MKPFLFVVASFLPVGTFAAIDIQPHVLEVQQKSAVVTVTNHGTETEYITVQLYQLNNPGELPEQESLTPVSEQVQPALFAAPAKMTLGPQQSGKILLNALSSPDKEQVYRLAVTPVNNRSVSGNGAVLGVQLSYMGLIRHLPASQQHQWTHHCINGSVKLHNTGNTRLQWYQLEAQSRVIDDFNLYPGKQRQLAVRDVRGMVESETFNLRCPAGKK
ncbi:hypothetical protein [Yersinia enterocolitica]|uniref:hypothetical protein n=1 Tax=Yersinia enterocolitica TaxID=630 RepID=UPI0005E8E82E|nr:hypothetical protein [Yersinia enterocolitica]MCE3128439.1 hypothetical protein [Yersinia enterocolitica]CFQ12533.1 alpha-related fimbriae chaperone 2 [Yersinia enterocolitica]CNJ02455.1 alpha-related fimbriae chaperone 2 [Yersinia enterocolitica]